MTGHTMFRRASIIFLALAGTAAARDVRFTDARTGQPLTPPAAARLATALAPLDDAGTISDAVLAHFAENGQPVTEVEVDPAAAAAPGPLEVRVWTGRFSAVATEGNSPWMTRAVSRQARSFAGKSITMSQVTELLDWVQRNPFHVASATFAPGPEPATADATLSLKSDRLARVYGGWENNGVEPLSKHRFTAGFEAADVAGVPLWLNGEVFGGEDVADFHGARGVVRLFLPWRHELRLAGAWTEGTIDGFLPGLQLTSEVTSWDASARWVIPLPRWRGWQADVGVGADFRRTESGVSVQGLVVEAAADKTQFALDLSAQRETDGNRSGIVVSSLWSPGGLTADDSDEAHGALRPGAEAESFIARGEMWTLQALPAGWELTGRLAGQWTADPLLPADELSLAGSRTVRGYEEATILADSAWWAAVEVRAPAWSAPVFSRPLSLQPLAFVDGGQGRDLAADTTTDAASAGLGVRLRWGQTLGVAVDYAWRLTEPGGRAHIAVQFAF